MIAIAQPSSGLDPLLFPDREEPYHLREVYEKIIYGCRDEIILDLADCFLRIALDRDSDTITAEFHGNPFGSKRGYRRIGSTSPWKAFLNQECGWTWLAINQQGYRDSILISFEGIVPNVLLNVMASSIYVFKIGPMENLATKTTNHRTKDAKALRRHSSSRAQF